MSKAHGPYFSLLYHAVNWLNPTFPQGAIWLQQFQAIVKFLYAICLLGLNFFRQRTLIRVHLTVYKVFTVSE